MLTTRILQVINNRERHRRVRSALKLRELSPECKDMIKLVDRYFKEFPSHDSLDHATALSLFACDNPKASESALLMVEDRLKAASGSVNEETIRGLMRSLQELAFSNDLSNTQLAYEAGGDIDLFQAVMQLDKKYAQDLKRIEDITWADESIEDMLEEDANGTKYNWRHLSLRGSCPNMEPGDQIIVALRPGKGKTSWMADQLTAMAKQIPDGRPAVWFNNEGPRGKVRRTLFRAGLSSTMSDMHKAGPEAVRKAWIDNVGPVDCIRVFNVHGKTYHQLEDLIIQHNPGIVVWDMLDNVHGFDEAERKDLKLEHLYQWAREMAVQHDFLSLPTSQLSNDAMGVMWPDQSMLKDSKVGKQGACETIICIGDSLDPLKESDRYIHVAKTKYTPLPGHRANCLATVRFVPEIAHFEDIKEI